MPEPFRYGRAMGREPASRAIAFQTRPGRALRPVLVRVRARIAVPVIAAVPQAAPPTIRASRGLAPPIAPMIVAPIGVLPTNAVDHSAVTRPR
jgi:hypothetical protein